MNRLLTRSLFRIPAAVAGVTIIGLALTAAAQTRTARKVDPQAQLLNNYRKYPDRYIRISNETWRYDDTNQTAFHSFTLKNNAGVAYSGIQVRVNYLNDDGKTLQSQVLNVPGTLAAYEIKKIKDIRNRKVPPQCTQAVISISTAVIGP
jgi:hypothetical protein